MLHENQVPHIIADEDNLNYRAEKIGEIKGTPPPIKFRAVVVILKDQRGKGLEDAFKDLPSKLKSSQKIVISDFISYTMLSIVL